MANAKAKKPPDVPPYSYGDRWLLGGECLLVPFGWVACPATPTQDVELDWINNSLEDTWSLNCRFWVITNRVDRLIKNGCTLPIMFAWQNA